MKKILVLLLSLLVIVTFASCNSNTNDYGIDDNSTSSTPTEGNFSMLLYPLSTSESVYSSHTDIPEIIFCTTGAENGLGSTIYSFTGKMIGKHDKLDDAYFVVETKYGNVLMMNVYYDIKNYMPVDEDCYAVPEIGEVAKFACIYDGFSGTADMPCFVYGNDALLLSDYEDIPEDTKDTEEATTVPQKTENIVYEGSGDQVITGVNLEEGRYKVHIVYTGNSVFAVFGYDADDDIVLMKSSYGACDSCEVLRQAKFPIILEITADTSWKIEFEKID